MVETQVLKQYRALAEEWGRDLTLNFEKVLCLTKNEARTLVGIWRARGAYSATLKKSLRIKRSTLSSILQKFKENGVIETKVSPFNGNTIHNIADTSLARAFMSASFRLCICDSISRKEVSEDAIFD